LIEEMRATTGVATTNTKNVGAYLRVRPKRVNLKVHPYFKAGE